MPNGSFGFIPAKKSWLLEAVDVNNGPILRVQDRVIRLEERLRLSALMPEASRSRVEELTIGQLIGLRFASDAEAPALVEQALSTGMKGREIKKSIRVWRPDYFRV